MKKKEKRVRMEDVLIALIVVGTFFFIRKVNQMFLIVGSEPSALVAGYFSLVTAELAILWRLHESRKKREQKDAEDEFDYIDIDEGGHG